MGVVKRGGVLGVEVDPESDEPPMWFKKLRSWSTFCSASGKSRVEQFAESFMPNAFSEYEKAKGVAGEMQQVHNEFAYKECHEAFTSMKECFERQQMRRGYTAGKMGRDEIKKCLESMNGAGSKVPVYISCVMRFAEARTRFACMHFVLANYLMMHEFGVMTAEDLARVDEKSLLGGSS